LIRLFSSGEEHPALEGSVEAVRVVRDRHCRVGKGIAYIMFRTRVAAMAALRMNGSDCGGREMRVMKVQSSGKAGAGKGAQCPQNKKILPGGVHKKKVGGGTKKDQSQRATHGPKKSKRDQKRPAVAARKMKTALAKNA
jgi:RNA recognition motif-containing protein